MHVPRLIKVGAATAVILPSEMLNHLRAEEGQQVFAVETRFGYMITALDPGAQQQVTLGEDFIDRYQDVFAGLAK